MPDSELSSAVSSDLTASTHRSAWVAQSGQNSGGAAGSFDAMPAGGGTLEADVCIIGAGTAGLAVYKDEGGELHCPSAICPLLGGVVRWNAEAKNWDCPCHGSRFDTEGAVLNGPSPTGLGRASL